MPVMQDQKSKMRSRLGRGLSSLISVSDPEETVQTEPAHELRIAQPLEPAGRPTSGFVELPLELIDANPHQPRRSFDEGSLIDLAASIKSTGVIQPIVVKPAGERY